MDRVWEKLMANLFAIWRFVVVVLIATFSLIGCSTSTDSPESNSQANSASGQASGAGLAERVVVMLNWYPEAEHGGIYAAKLLGIFEKNGLDVEIRPGGPNAPVVQELMVGRAQFALGNADDVLLFREQKAPVVALMTATQRTPRCILVRSDSKANSLSELRGMTLQANVGRPFLSYMRKKGMLEDVKVVPYSGSIADLVVSPNVAIQAYSFSEPLVARQKLADSNLGVKLFELSEIGYNPYASCMMTTEDLIRDRSDMVARFVKSVREGWQEYLKSPTTTNQAILKLNEHGLTMEALEFGAVQLKELCTVEGGLDQFGMMDASRWKELNQQLTDLELTSLTDDELQKAFTLQYLKADLNAEPATE